MRDGHRAGVDPAALDARGAAVRDVNIVGDLLPGDYHVEVTVRGSFGVASRATRLRVVGAP